MPPHHRTDPHNMILDHAHPPSHSHHHIHSFMSKKVCEISQSANIVYMAMGLSRELPANKKMSIAPPHRRGPLSTCPCSEGRGTVKSKTKCFFGYAKTTILSSPPSPISPSPIPPPSLIPFPSKIPSPSFPSQFDNYCGNQ